MQKITPFLWFNNNAEEAIDFYISVFNNSPTDLSKSKIISIKRYPNDMQIGPVPDMGGKILTAVFELAGQQFMALDGGPTFKFTEAISMLVECENQEEIDYFWKNFSFYPENEQCGWCKDKFGLSWQIVPADMDKWMAGPDNEKSKRATEAMLNMKKIVIKDLQKAYDQG